MGNRKNERKGNKEAQVSAALKLAEAEAALAFLRSAKDKTPEIKEEIRRAEKQVTHWRAKSREKSEQHSQRHKR